MFKRFAVAASVAALTVATPAFAQDAGTFTGFYIGAIAGWDHPDFGGEEDGLLYGVTAGYDFDLGGAVLGLEVEANDSTAKDCRPVGLMPGDEFCDTAGLDLYVGGRVGAEVGPGTLLYAKGGYTNAKVKGKYHDGGSGAGDFSNSDHGDGVRVGAGVEHQFGGNVFVKAEYRYSNYEAGVERHQVVGGVGFRFGGN